MLGGMNATRSRRSCEARLRMPKAANVPLGSSQRLQPDRDRSAGGMAEHMLVRDIPAGLTSAGVSSGCCGRA